MLLKALRAAAAGDREQPGEGESIETAGVSAETPPAAGERVVAASSDLADALLVVAESFLAGKVAGADDAEVYQVVLHLGADAVTPSAPPAAPAPPGVPSPPARAVGVSAETPPCPGDPADPARCHVEDGAAVPVTTAQMIGCTAALSWMTHAAGGAVLNLGRRRRRASKAIRKAARERDQGRCRYPGCESRRVDLHHVQYWSNGGETSLENLVSLCKFHHMAVHDRGCLIAARPGGSFAFYAPGGAQIPSSPALPSPDGNIADLHDADITPDTVIPSWYGERLDLDYAIYTCLANEQVRRDRAVGRDSGQEPDVEGYQPGGWYPFARQSEISPLTYFPVQIPIQV